MPLMATMLGRGLYDAAEIGHLLGHDPEWVVRWSTPSVAGPAPVVPTFDRLFSVADLVSFRVVAIVRANGISDRHLRHGVETLRSWTGRERPLAQQRVVTSLATSGNSFLSDLASGELEDIGRGGQGVFQDVVRIHLTRITFAADGEAERWNPAEGVVIDPAIQAGAPCIIGTRVPTATVASLLAEVDAEELALDFDVTVEAITLAERFEHRLAAGRGLAA
jgi:uncharacterized protein (DUF433 family)